MLVVFFFCFVSAALIFGSKRCFFDFLRLHELFLKCMTTTMTMTTTTRTKNDADPDDDDNDDDEDDHDDDDDGDGPNRSSCILQKVQIFFLAGTLEKSTSKNTRWIFIFVIGLRRLCSIEVVVVGIKKTSRKGHSGRLVLILDTPCQGSLEFGYREFFLIENHQYRSCCYQRKS